MQVMWTSFKPKKGIMHSQILTVSENKGLKVIFDLFLNNTGIQWFWYSIMTKHDMYGPNIATIYHWNTVIHPEPNTPLY